jgi:hypothetical protein
MAFLRYQFSEWRIEMKQKKLLIFIAGLLLLSMALAACGSSSSSGFPLGKFVKSGSENYGLNFNEDGTFSVFDGNITLVKGTYSVNGDTFTEESNNGGCVSPMSFKYSFDGTNLTFNYAGNPADDTCDGRRADFDNQTYTLTK